jgi:hypothetical protein
MPVIWYTVTTEFNGKPVTGSYSVSKQLVTVRYGGGSKAMESGGFPEATAKMLLRELANKTHLTRTAKRQVP